MFLYYISILLSVIKIIFENISDLYKKRRSVFIRISVLKCDLLISFFQHCLKYFLGNGCVVVNTVILASGCQRLHSMGLHIHL